MIVKIEDAGSAKELFAGWTETLIWSCLQGVMGSVYGDHAVEPSSAMAALGDFCFLAGRPGEELALYRPEECRTDFRILVPRTKGWADCIEGCFGKRARKTVRYAFQKDPGGFDLKKLRHMAGALPPEYAMQLLDEGIYQWCQGQDWCRDWVAQYPDFGAYQKEGLGVVVLKDGIPVSGASSYSSYWGGIEIEIDTKEEYRRKGLARACGARLILECLDRGLYPSWDAQNLWSAKLAKQLGYQMEGPYTAYEVRLGTEGAEAL